MSPLHDVGREGTGFARFSIEMDSCQRRSCDDIVCLRVRHLVKEPDYSFSYFQNSRLNCDQISREQLTFVDRFLLHSGHASPIVGQVGWSNPNMGQQMPCGLVELARVPHYVHVAHMIAVPGIDDSAMS